MSKISIYDVVPVPKLADKLIGTSVGGDPEDLTYNFTLAELLNLFIPNIPGNTLQGVLDFGNTATQNINLTGTVNTTNLTVSATANILNSNLTGQTHITGGLFDRLNSIGTAGQVLTSTGTQVQWYTIPTVIPNLQQVLTSGNTAVNNIILTGDLSANNAALLTSTISTSLTLLGTLRDGLNAVGANNQVLSSNVTGVRWINLPVYSAASPLLYNSVTGVFSIQQANASQGGFLSAADWITFDGKQTAIILTTTGNNGPSTLIGSTINVPNYTLAGLNGVPQTRILSINGVAYNLSADRSWTISAGVSSVTATSPLFSTGGATPVISIQQSSSSLDGYLSSADWLTFDGKQDALTFSSPLVNTAGTISIPAATSSVSGYLTSTDWTTFNSKQDALTLTTTGTSGPSTLIGNTLNIPTYADQFVGTVTSVAALTLGTIGTDLSSTVANSTTTPVITLNVPTASAVNRGALSSADWTTFNNKQIAGNYITSLTGEATALGPGAAAVTLDNAAVISKVLTGLNVTGGTVVAADSILTGFGKVQNQINGLIGGSIFQGTWNASTNTPTLVSSVGTNGHYYIVSVAGTTNLDGITDWQIGDWAIFAGTTWEKVDNTDAVSSVNGFTGAVSLTTDNIPEGATNLYFTNTRARTAISLTTTGSSGASTYDNTTGVFNIPNYADQFVGTVTSVGLSSATSGVTIGSTPITTSGIITIAISTATASQNGLLSSTDWTTFNSKQGAITLTTTGTSGVSTLVGSTLNIPNYTTNLTGYVPYTGATTNVDLGDFVLTSGGLNVDSLGGNGGALNLRQATSFSTWSGAPFTSIYATTGNKVVFSFSNDNRTFTLDGSIVSAASPRTFTFPDASGTLALVGGAGVGTVTSVSFSLGSSGTDLSASVANSTTTPAITLNVPTASASARGALSAADWTTFNSKQPAGNYVTLDTTQTITALKTILRSGDVLNFKIGVDTLYGLKIAYNQNEIVPAGEATWSFENTFNNGSGTGLTTTPLAFFRGVLVTGERLLSVSVNTNLLDYYGNNPSGRYPIYVYNTGVQQFASSIIVGETNGVVNAVTGAISDLPAGVVANFKGRVIGSNAVNSNEFITLSQATSTSRLAISLTTTGSSGPATYNNTTGVFNIPEYAGTVNPSAREIQTFIATAGQTVFTVTGGYTVGLVDVFINGVRLTSSDFVATNGTTVVLTVGTAVNNIVDIIKYTSGIVNSISGSGTTNELAYFTASTTIASLTTATYPSLTELSYVKGVTSSIQTQLNGKQAAGTYVTSVTGTSPIVSSGGTTPAISIPVATTSVNGYLSSTDWTTFNSKQNALTNPVTGTGTTNYLPKFTGSTTIGNSQVFDNGTNVGINTASPVSTNLVGSQTIVKSYNSDTPTSTTAQTYYTNQSSLYLFGRNSGLSIISNNNEEGHIIFGNASTVAYASIQTGSAATSVGGDMYFKVGSNTERMRITSGGNVLIGTTTDNGEKFQVNGKARFTSAPTLGDSQIQSYSNSAGNTSYGSVLIVSSTGKGGYLTIGDNSATTWYGGQASFVTLGATSGAGMKFRVDADDTKGITIPTSGNVGIGTASPATNLTIEGTNRALPLAYNTGYGNLHIQSNETTITQNFGGSLTFGGLGRTSGPTEKFTWAEIAGRKETTITGDPKGYLQFGTLNDDTNEIKERMRITSGGYLKASNNGSYTSSTGTYHEFNNNANDNETIAIRHTGSAPFGISISYTGASPNNTSKWFAYFQDTTALRFEVRSNGGISNYQANNTNLSDERTKKDIEPLESYWDKFKAIEIVKFKYKDQTHDDFNIGVIAQQVEAIAPEFVDVDGWGETPKNEEPFKSIYTADLYHATIKVLQEAMRKIEELKAELDELKNKN